jgi:AcrR family transcriptional regulator
MHSYFKRGIIVAGIREKKKQENQKNIIKAAKKIFTDKGYQRTTMAEIAEEANVGTGTIYNYFPSKGVLLLAVFTEETAQIQIDNQALMKVSGNDFIETILELMKGITSFFHCYPKSFWREILHVITEEADESSNLRRDLFGLDEEMVHWVKQIFQQYSHCFLIPVNEDEAAWAVYSAAMMQTMLYIYEEAVTYEQFLYGLNSQIQFIFKGKLK